MAVDVEPSCTCIRTAAGSSDDGSSAKGLTMSVDLEVPGCVLLAAIFPFPLHFTQCLLLNLHYEVCMYVLSYMRVGCPIPSLA